MMNSFVRIDPSNVITMLANHSEFGNGAYTVMSMMLAEELDVDYRSISVEAAPTTPGLLLALVSRVPDSGIRHHREHLVADADCGR